MARKTEKSIWENEAGLAILDDKRAAVKGRMTFNCFNTSLKDGRVTCTQGFKLGKAEDGTMLDFAVLKGSCASACKECPKYDTQDEKPGKIAIT